MSCHDRQNQQYLPNVRKVPWPLEAWLHHLQVHNKSLGNVRNIITNKCMRDRPFAWKELHGRAVPNDTGKRKGKKPPIVRSADPGYHPAYHRLGSLLALFTLLLMLHIQLGVPPIENHVPEETNPLLTIIHWVAITTKSSRTTNITDPFLGSCNMIFPTLIFHFIGTAMIRFITTKKRHTVVNHQG